MADNIKIKTEGKYSTIAEYLYENSLIPNFEEYMEEQKDIIKSKAKEKGYSSKKLQYIIYISIDEGGAIRAEIEGREREDYINSFKSYKIYMKHNYVSKYGWCKEHQQNIFRLFQEVEIESLRRKNEELRKKLKEYEDNKDE